MGRSGGTFLGVGTMREMRSVEAGLFLPSLLFREHTLGGKIKLWCGKARSEVSSIWSEVISSDLAAVSTVFAVPVYLFHGRLDYTCSYDLAREYFKLIEAPKLVAILSEEILPRLE